MEQAIRKPVTEGAILTRSLEQLLGSLIRLLVGRISLVRLEELIRKSYVQESEKRLKADFPNRRVTLSQLALMTGIDTRALTKITNNPSYAQPAHENEAFLNDITPETRILSVWMSDPRFCNPSTGKPLALSLGSKSPSFAQLITCLGSTRGVTQQSILSRLEMARSIEVDWKRQRVQLVASDYYPYLSNDESAMLDVGFSTVAHLLGTIGRNLATIASGGEKLFQRITFTHTLSPQRRGVLRQHLRNLLSASDDKCREAIGQLEEEVAQPGQITAGVSMFYFEADGGL